MLHKKTRCPRCGGALIRNRTRRDIYCINCGWRPDLPEKARPKGPGRPPGPSYR